MSKPQISRGFRPRKRPGPLGERVPPGQHVVSDFPVLSAGPTPSTSLDAWTFALQEGGSLLARWTWAEFEALPQTTVVVDIHCVTAWSKLDTEWQGVTIDALLEAAGESRAIRANAHRLLEIVGLPAGTADRYPHELSGALPDFLEGPAQVLSHFFDLSLGLNLLVERGPLCLLFHQEGLLEPPVIEVKGDTQCEERTDRVGNLRLQELRSAQGKRGKGYPLKVKKDEGDDFHEHHG